MLRRRAPPAPRLVERGGEGRRRRRAAGQGWREGPEEAQGEGIRGDSDRVRICRPPEISPANLDAVGSGEIATVGALSFAASD